MKKNIIIPCLACALLGHAQKFKVEENTVKPEITFTLKKGGLTSSARLSLHVEEGKEFSKTGVLANVKSEAGKTLTLEPKINLAFGTKYKVVVNGLGKPYSKVFTTPEVIKVDRELTMEFVFPLAIKDTVPANNMLYYISFNTPMQQDQLAYQHIELIDDKGKVIDRPWRERTFWMDEGKMMTVMVHPAKLKRGIMERVGVAIEENRSYTIRIGDGIRDIYNRTVNGNREVKLHAITRDTLMPKLLDVNATPVARSFSDIKIRFSEMMDYGSVLSYVRIKGEDDKLVPVKVSYVDKSKEWILRPEKEWKPGVYRLEFVNALMDVAGNQLNRPFETEEPPFGQNDVFQRFSFRVQ